MTHFGTQSLGRRLAWRFLAGGLLLALISSSVQTWRFYRHAAEDAEILLNSLAKSHEPPLSEAAAAGDLLTLKNWLAELAEISPLVYVRLERPDAPPLEFGRPVSTDSRSITLPLIDRHHAPPRQLGQLRLTASLSRTREQLWLVGLVNLLEQTVIFLLLAGLFIRISQWQVAEPLEKLARQLQQAETSGHFSPLSLARPGEFDDELAQLVRALNRWGEESARRRIELDTELERRSQIEHQLESSRRLLRSSFAAIQDRIVLIDRDLRIIDSNLPLADRGRHEDSCPQCHQVLRGRSEPCHNCPVRDVIATGRPVQRDFYDQRTGETWEIRAFPIKDETGRVELVVEAMRDITSRQRLEEELRHGAQRLQTALEQGRMGFWELDLVTKRVSWSPQLFRLFHRDPARGDPTLEELRPLITPEDLNLLIQVQQAVRTSRIGGELELTVVLPDGARLFLAATLAPLTDDTGQVYRLCGVIQDITARQRQATARDELLAQLQKYQAELQSQNQALLRAHQQLDASRRRYTSLFEFSPAPCLMLDSDQVIREANRQAGELLGRPAGRLTGLSLADFLATEADRERCRRQLADCWAQQSAEPTELWLAPEENRRVVVLESHLAADETGQQVCLAALRDITDRKRAEEILEAQRYQLEREVADRTNELNKSMTYLEQVNAKLAEADRHKSRFLSSMSHELRTPLNAILGFADLLGGQFFGPLSAKQTEYVKRIDGSAKHLLALIKDLLDLARIDAGGANLNLEEVALGEAVALVTAMIQRECAKKEQELIVEQSRAPERLVADRRFLNQILLNLLGNAVKFTPVGGRITLTIETLAPDRVRFTVADTGVGIPAEEQDRIFSEFYQADRKRDAQLGGVGIGLALTRRLVGLHQGQIGVESQPGQGATFRVVLPLVPPGYAPPAAPSAEADGSASTRPARRQILVAEDNETNLALLIDMLSIQGHEVIVAHNGLEALDQARRQKPDLILMDIRMPLLDGLETTRRLRQIPEFADLPIIALTASAGIDAHERCLAAGCTAYLSKPLQSQELNAILARHLPKG